MPGLVQNQDKQTFVAVCLSESGWASNLSSLALGPVICPTGRQAEKPKTFLWQNFGS